MLLLIWGRDQQFRPRQIGTTGESNILVKATVIARVACMSDGGHADQVGLARLSGLIGTTDVPAPDIASLILGTLASSLAPDERCNARRLGWQRSSSPPAQARSDHAHRWPRTLECSWRFPTDWSASAWRAAVTPKPDRRCLPKVRDLPDQKQRFARPTSTPLPCLPSPCRPQFVKTFVGVRVKKRPSSVVRRAKSVRAMICAKIIEPRHAQCPIASCQALAPRPATRQ